MNLRAIVSCLLLVACAGTPPPMPSPVHDLAIAGATILSGNDPPLTDATIYLDGDTIARIERGAALRPSRRLIDASGKYVIPGLIDSHVHIGHPVGLDMRTIRERPALIEAYWRQLPRSYLYFGFTTLIDPDLSPQAKERFGSEAIRPALYHCGRGIRLLDGYGMNFVDRDERFDAFPNFVAEDGTGDIGIGGSHKPGDAIAQVRAASGICAKTYFERGFGGVFDLPVPSPALLRGIGESAHAAGLPMMVHATSDEGYARALDAGADILAHGLWHWPGEPTPDVPPQVRAVLDRVVEMKAYVQPTLRVVAGERDEIAGCPACDERLPEALPFALVEFLKEGGAEWSREELHELYRRSELRKSRAMTDEQAIAMFVERSRRTTAYLAQKRARLIFGTDTPATRGGGNAPGLNGLREIEAWVEAGIPLHELFQALTLRNAQAFGLAGTLGTISAGKRADLLILTKNPLETASAYDAIETVILGGQQIARQALVATPEPSVR